MIDKRLWSFPLASGRTAVSVPAVSVFLPRFGIQVPKYHTGCNAARHTSTTNDGIENSKLPPKQRRKAEEKQAAERGHSAQTACEVYDGAHETPNEAAQQCAEAFVGLANHPDEFANEGFLDDGALANIAAVVAHTSATTATNQLWVVNSSATVGQTRRPNGHTPTPLTS